MIIELSEKDVKLIEAAMLHYINRWADDEDEISRIIEKIHKPVVDETIEIFGIKSRIVYGEDESCGLHGNILDCEKCCYNDKCNMLRRFGEDLICEDVSGGMRRHFVKIED